MNATAIECLETASIVILDGDSRIDPETGEKFQGAPPPSQVHGVLKSLDVQHHIYTTHSHVTKGNRYRVLIPVKLDNQNETHLEI